MKKVLLLTFGICIILAGLLMLTGFSFFSKRLTESKEMKEQSAIVEETSVPKQIYESRKEMGAIEQSLKIQILSPSHQSIVTSPYITLRGKTSAQAEVFVNDKETTADAQGNFSVALTLEEGENPIMIVVNDQNGNVGEEEISLVYEVTE
jgi:hypothetical protein